jgi:hypothetical protein
VELGLPFHPGDQFPKRREYEELLKAQAFAELWCKRKMIMSATYK